MSAPAISSFSRYVLGFMFDYSGNKVLLIEKLKPSWQAGLLNGIGGKIEQDESPLQAMTREFMEEACLATQPSDWVPFGMLEGVDFEVYVFKAIGNIKLAKDGTAERLVIVDRYDPSLPDRCLPSVTTLVQAAVDPDKPFVTLTYRELIEEKLKRFG